MWMTHTLCVPQGSRLKLSGLLTAEFMSSMIEEPDVQAALYEHLPPAHRNPQALRDLVRSPQLAQQIRMLNSAVSETPTQTLVPQLGLQPNPVRSANAPSLFPEGTAAATVRYGSFLPAFLQAIQDHCGAVAPTAGNEPEKNPPEKKDGGDDDESGPAPMQKEHDERK
ncbi:hypothetical protein PAPYR_10378 [Paratrimastix pyriformis]|uniref:DEUBAD domain-containing protein n=1 Tax=Paratrimastix pyriformis TaxID=342808 RepID=A0ABQ8UDA2_9EUKA|nr:hypothetical protein PAPYR_10378 [Paratrimastix pyriformis]